MSNKTFEIYAICAQALSSPIVTGETAFKMGFMNPKSPLSTPTDAHSNSSS